MLFLSKIFSFKKKRDIFLRIIFLSVVIYCWNTSFSINNWLFFLKPCLLKNLLEILPNLCQLITSITFLLHKICWEGAQSRAICDRRDPSSAACGSTKVRVLRVWVVLTIIPKINHPKIYGMGTQVCADEEELLSRALFQKGISELLFLELLGGWTLLSHPTIPKCSSFSRLQQKLALNIPKFPFFYPLSTMPLSYGCSAPPLD